MENGTVKKEGQLSARSKLRKFEMKFGKNTSCGEKAGRGILDVGDGDTSSGATRHLLLKEKALGIGQEGNWGLVKRNIGEWREK
ncbi:MAG: hypothetical protein IKO41_06585 [Lachnospiraceae bacterium]|nr:hypothetical protein [Lachnospiraceae bacterium]MBR6151483.1 hypothetical protein [Lachnospiraceae bacterium]